jgi:hypothetical protein
MDFPPGRRATSQDTPARSNRQPVEPPGSDRQLLRAIRKDEVLEPRPATFGTPPHRFVAVEFLVDLDDEDVT